FVSPPLAPGQEYVYHLRVRWTDNERTQRLIVRPGDTLTFDFMGYGGAEDQSAPDVPQASAPTPVYRFAPVWDRGASPTRTAPFSEQSPSQRGGPPGSNNPSTQGVGNG